MKLDSFVLGFIAFSVVILTGVAFIGDINNSYSLTMNTSDFNEVYNTINETYDIGQQMKSQTIDADISETDSWESMTKGSYSAVRIVKQTFTLSGDIINAIAIKLQIPGYFVTFAIISLLIMIVFAIIYLFMRFIPR